MPEYTAPVHVVTGTDISSSAHNAQALDNIDHLKALSNAQKGNADGVSHPQGTLAKLNATSGAVVRTTSAGQAGPLGVVVASAGVASGVGGWYAFTGMAFVLCTGAIAVGDQLQSSSTAGTASAGGTNPFAVAHGSQASGTGLVLAEIINPIGSVTLAQHDHTGTSDGGLLTNAEHDGYSRYDEIAAPSAPAASTTRLYAYDKSGTTEMAYTNEAGVVRDLSLAGTAVDHNHTAIGDGGVLDSPRLTDDLRTSANAILAQIVGTAGLAIGSAANMTTDTSPFLYITTSAGPPTGVPTAATGRVAVHYDSTNKRVYLYDTGTAAWVYLPIGTQTANTVLAGPASGGAAQAGYRALGLADIPTITQLGQSTATADQTTSSTSFVDITGDTASKNQVTLTTEACTLLFFWTGVVAVGANGNRFSLQTLLDGGSAIISGRPIAIATNQSFPFAHIGRYSGVAAAAHTLKMQWVSTDGATLTLASATLVVLEIRK